MDISGLESLIRNHPVLFASGTLAGAYIGTIGTFSLLTYLTKRKIRSLKKEARFYVDFLKDSPLLDNPKIRRAYNRGLELVGDN